MMESRFDNVRVYEDQPLEVDVVRDLITEQQSNENDDDAFFAMDMGYHVKMLEKWKRLLPRVHPFFAIKANPDPVLLEMMTKLNIGFDCASKSEIETILAMGYPASKIIYANTRKQQSHLRYAYSAGITLTTFADKDELYKMKEYAPDMGLLLRLSTSSFTNASIQGMTMKFGCYLNETVILLETAKELNLSVKGVSFHVGTGCTDPMAYGRAIQESKRVFEEATRLGFRMTILDIGGGFPCETTNGFFIQDEEHSFEKYASIIREALAESFPAASDVRVIAEPGACLTMPSAVLATNIIGLRDNRERYGRAEITAPLEYFINDGPYTSAYAYRRLPDLEPCVQPVSNEFTGAARSKCALWGQTCGDDLITKNIQLPVMKRGDWLFFTVKGGYSRVFSTEFNGFKTPPVYRYISKSMIGRFDAMVKDYSSEEPNAWEHLTHVDVMNPS